RNQTVSNNLIRSFVVLIVALGIASVLVVSVVQKQKEIGILRAMGARRGMILQVFLIQGAVVGAVGSVLGSALAFTLLRVFSSIYRNADGSPLFSPQLELRFIVMAALVATAVGLLSALIPARRAARMDPVQAIRA
ncbi:MAG TPA: FtsX-like permease family protein, partial [Rhodocyclaceae bacterium]|nr:FtsX-like permease family protein [Rhodocyclaceae bacterium]